jgi:hypothetical protein
MDDSIRGFDQTKQPTAYANAFADRFPTRAYGFRGERRLSSGQIMNQVRLGEKKPLIKKRRSGRSRWKQYGGIGNGGFPETAKSAEFT